MHAVILAGGRGVQLRPYSTSLPKPLVPIGGRYAILEIVLTQLSDQGFSSVTLAIGHLGHLIRSFVGNGSRWGIDVEYVVEEQPLGTIGPILGMLDCLPSHVLVMNGDVLTDMNYAQLLAQHMAKRHALTLATYARDVLIDFGVLEVDAGRVVSFREKPRQHYRVSTGVYALSTDALRRYPGRRHFGFDDLVIDLLEHGEPPASIAFDGFWLDIGRGDDYERANEEFAGLATRLLPSGVRHPAGECPPTQPVEIVPGSTLSSESFPTS